MKNLLAWLAVLVPALLGIGLNLMFASGGFPNPVVAARADVGMLCFIFGVLLSTLGFGAVALNQWHQRGLLAAQAQTQALAANDRRRFLQRLDHELKNPLTAIRAGLANITGTPDNAARHEAMQSVEAQVRRVSRLTADLRKLAELETRSLEHVPVNLSELLPQVFELAQDRPEAAERKLQLTIQQAPWPLAAVPGDRDLLLLVVHNLMDNAIKFSRPGDTVELRAFEDGAAVVIEVADTGPGIAEEDLPHVWEELYRGKSARSVPGSGLGLALAQAIVQRHGGQVTLRSRTGQGTVFTVRLPLKS